MKILITGSSGFLGSIFCWKALEAGDEVLGTLLNSQGSLRQCKTKPLDIRDPEACLTIGQTFKPDVIIHCARYSVGTGQCEKDRETTFQINSIGTRNMAWVAEKCGAFLVYISTDWIFSGRKPLGENYQEDEDPCPLSYYGFTKWAGEQEVFKTRTRYLILRPSNIYGVHALFLEAPSSPPKEVMARSSWSHRMVKKIEQGEKIWLPDSLYQSPILANHLAEITLRLVKEEKTGVYHVAGRDSMSRYQFMQRLIESLGLDPNLVLQGSLRELEVSWETPQGISGILPENTSLDVGKVERTLKTRMMTLEEGLSAIRDYMKK